MAEGGPSILPFCKHVWTVFQWTYEKYPMDMGNIPCQVNLGMGKGHDGLMWRNTRSSYSFILTFTTFYTNQMSQIFFFNWVKFCKSTWLVLYDKLTHTLMLQYLNTLTHYWEKKYIKQNKIKFNKSSWLPHMQGGVEWGLMRIWLASGTQFDPVQEVHGPVGGTSLSDLD